MKTDNVLDLSKATEAELREYSAPWPKTEDELLGLIHQLVDRPHDYGTCVYAMSIAAEATFNYVSDKLGVTGFQASCADMDILRRTRGYKHGFMVLDAAKLLYPQYDVLNEVRHWISKTEARLSDEARRLLNEKSPGDVHPDVRARWATLAEKVEDENK